jgi:2-polyprenyl-3-methyl-5-hydroxy-6-metoxy-1,4-benzoquinol methylase
MSRFTHRSSQSELIDAPDIPFSDWEVCLRELNTINTYLGGHAITIEGIRRLTAGQLSNKQFTVCEIGCGGGDNLKAIHKEGIPAISFRYIGIDLNEACIAFARKSCSELNADFICSDYKLVDFGSSKPDIIFNSLFCHHFTNEQLIEMLRWMKDNSTTGFFINDLQRHPLAYHSIKVLTQLFSRSYLVKNDAPISVQRGFLKSEWEALLDKAGISRYEIRWRWAFRHLVLVKHD